MKKVSKLVFAFIILVTITLGQDKNYWRVLPIPPPRPVTFWMIHRWQDSPLRSNRQTLRSPWFIIPHTLALAATIVDYRRQRGQPNATHDWADPFVPLAAATGLDYVSDRFLGRPFSVAVATFIIVRHTYGAVSGNYP